MTPDARARRSSRSAAGTASRPRSRAIRRYAGSITAVVSVADDGGSSGRLRRDFGVLPPGDLRRCLVALADDDTWGRAFEHRFSGGELDGHALGNLMLVGLTDTLGDFTAALDEAGRVLRAVGRVLPGHHRAGRAQGESWASARSRARSRCRTAGGSAGSSWCPADAPASPDAVAAIAAADQVVLAPGSLYTSLLPVLCVARAPATRSRPRRRASSRSPTSARRCPRPLGLDGVDHLQAVLDHGARVDSLLYAVDGALAFDDARVRALGVEPPARPAGPAQRPRPRSGTVGERAVGSAVVGTPEREGSMTVRVGINGFGRIGRSFTRALLARGADAGIELVAVNEPMGDTHTVAFLLKHDSVGGTLPNDIQPTANGISIDGHEIQKLEVMDPAEIPWSGHDVDVVIESTGLFTAREKAAGHLGGTVQRVIISAPSGDADASICMGVNDEVYDPSAHTVISNASCTTNCLAPMAKVLNDTFGIEQGLMTTVHAYTSDQSLVDLAKATRSGKPDLRRMRVGRAVDHPEQLRRGARDRPGAARAQGQARRRGAAGARPDRLDHRPLGEPRRSRPTIDEINEAFAKAAADPSYRGVLEYSRRGPRVRRHRGQPGVVHLLVGRHDGERAPGEGAGLVRQRVGLLQPARRPRRLRRAVARRSLCP